MKDHEGEGGWIHYALLSRKKTVLIVGQDVEMFAKAVGLSRLVAKLTNGVVGTLDECSQDLCLIEVASSDSKSFRGWVPKEFLWGPLSDD